MSKKNLLSESMEIIRKYPLCDHCLGSLYARLGKGLGNKARGEAIRRSIIMEIDRMIREGELKREEASSILSNLSEPETAEIAKALGIDLTLRDCFVCSSSWNHLVEYWSERVAEVLKDYEFNTFLIGCTNCGEIEVKQRQIISEFTLPYSESVKNALKREIGKRVKEIINKEPDFNDPDIIAIIDIPSDKIYLQIKPVFIYGIYKKLGRQTSQSSWKYPHSVEDSLREALKEFGGEVILHAAGREDVDVRMLGSGRPFIAEIKRPKRRFVDIRNKEYFDGLVYFKFYGYTNRKDVVKLKNFDSLKDKIYLALVYVPEGISSTELKALEEFFKNIIVTQRTPTRVLHRRKDLLRQKKVKWIKTRLLNNKLFEVLIRCQGGLYIKELVSGDGGRTEPSFSSFLGKESKCISLDVVWVENPWGRAYPSNIVEKQYSEKPNS